MQVKVLKGSILDQPEWKQFLSASSLLLAAVLLGSALIMAIAANWLSWPKVGRVALLQGTITVFVFLAWYRAQQVPTDWSRALSLSSMGLALAAIAVGGLLALIGQSYQTGADPWQLFAVWALLLLPWLVVTRSLFIILIVLLLTNVAVFLFLEVDPAWGGFALLLTPNSLYEFILIALNGVFLALSHWAAPYYRDPYLLVRRLAAFLLMSAVVFWQSVAWLYQNTYMEWQNGISLLILGALGAWYLRRQQDLVAGAIFYGGFYIVALGFFVVTIGVWTSSVVLLFAFCAVVGWGLIWDLRRVWHNTEPSSHQKEPWFLRAFYLVVQHIVVMFFLLMFWMLFGVVLPLFTHLYLLVALGVIIYIQKNPNKWLQDLPLFLWLSSVFLAVVSLDVLTQPSWGVIGWLVALNGVVYAVSDSRWTLRFSSALMALGIIVNGIFWSLDQVWEYWADYSDVVLTGLFLGWLLLAWVMAQKTRWQQNLSPLWWAWGTLLVGGGLLSVDFPAIGGVEVTLQRLRWAVSAAVPAVFAYVLWRQYAWVWVIGGSLLLAIVSMVWLWAVPLANLALIAWLWSYARRDHVLLWCAGIVFLFALGGHYYAQDRLLITKAMELALAGAVLALITWLLRDDRTKPRGTTGLTNKDLGKKVNVRIGLGLIVGWGLILSVSGLDVWAKEKLLAEGQSVVLKLAPVDPRALMQGDYMALSFEVDRWLRQLPDAQAPRSSLSAKTLNVYVRPNAQGVAQLVAVQKPLGKDVWWWDEHLQQWGSPSQGENGLEQTQVVQLKYKKGRWLPSGIDAWFFPEGQAAYFAQAQYGEFKVTPTGKALLYQLLDEKAQPLTAP